MLNLTFIIFLNLSINYSLIHNYLIIYITQLCFQLINNSSGGLFNLGLFEEKANEDLLAI